MKYGFGQASVLLSGDTIYKLRMLELSNFNNDKTWEQIIQILIREHYELEELRKHCPHWWNYSTGTPRTTTTGKAADRTRTTKPQYIQTRPLRSLSLFL
jgi:hypothetical protein